ncbi:conserved hypothetical protein [Brucella sp. NVSL 07-0026]|nr:conserved hypothetical protein [Brucella sp. NVSL 07-0026]
MVDGSLQRAKADFDYGVYPPAVLVVGSRAYRGLGRAVAAQWTGQSRADADRPHRSAAQTALYAQTAVLIAMTHVLLPFVVLPIYGAIRNVPKDYGRAAAILGAGPMRTFFEVIFPLTLPGVIGGMILTFLTALGYFITPSLLGSPKEMMIATLISQQLRETLDWPFAAALVGVLTVLVTVVTLLFSRVFKFNRMMGGGV